MALALSPVGAPVPSHLAPAGDSEVESLTSRVGTAVRDFFTDAIVTLYEAMQWMCHKVHAWVYGLPMARGANHKDEGMPFLGPDNRSHQEDLETVSKDVKKQLDVHQNYPSGLGVEKIVNPSGQEDIRWVATPFGKKILRTPEISLSKDEVSASTPTKGPLLFALLMLRGTVFQTKPLRFRKDNDNAVATTDGRFEVPNFFTYKNIPEQAANDVTENQIIQLREDFWKLEDQDKQIILEHIDSTIETFEKKGVKKFKLLPKTPTEQLEMKAREAVISADGESVHRRLQEYASKGSSNNLFTFTFESSI
jgi:hypothetical protein